MNHAIGANIFRQGACQPEEIDAVMIEKPAIFCRQNRLDDMIRHVFKRNARLLENAALADEIAVAIKEGNRDIRLIAPIFFGFLKCRNSQRQKKDKPGNAKREGFIQNFNQKLFEAIYPQTV